MSCCQVFFVSCCALVATVPPVVVFALVAAVPPVVVFVGAFARRLSEVVAALWLTRGVLLCRASTLDPCGLTCRAAVLGRGVCVVTREVVCGAVKFREVTCGAVLRGAVM